ncbi:TOBE domain-containing protein [Haloarcula sp. JP-L23]|uniref:TOBE domain-containing protein n=1 Tax=Haloarcula sp. JP-L23 TaxID=2716717 RepID=UPI00140EA224|nr:TOBE domain-containing protein [Haloarcula sp. JP-L23]
MDASVDAQLQADGVAFTAADAELLRAIRDAGSVAGASEILGRSRARALDRIETLEAAYGPLVDRRRGGATGGGSELTETAAELLSRLVRLQATLAGTASVEECVVPGRVTERDGELGVVATDAGDVRARLVARDGGDLPDVDSPVQVSVRSDAVTLHAPTDAPAAEGTSARNRFEGTVVDVDEGATVVCATIDIGAPDSLSALLTHESLDRLGLRPGSRVVASFKATATRAIAAD